MANAGEACQQSQNFTSKPTSFIPSRHRVPECGLAFLHSASLSTVLAQGVRYEERVRPKRSASMYWVRSLALSRALETLSR